MNTRQIDTDDRAQVAEAVGAQNLLGPLFLVFFPQPDASHAGVLHLPLPWREARRQSR